MKAHGALFFLIFFPVAAWGQSLPGSGTGGTLHTVEMMKWIVYGRTTDVKGEPLGGVIVRVDVGVGIGSVRALKTNLQGEFQTEFSLDATQHKKLTVNLAASKAGYAPANETVEFASTDKSTGIELILRDLTENPDQLPMATLIATLAPRLRQDAAPRSGGEIGGKDIARGCEELIDHHKAANAVPFLSKGVERAPACLECRLLLSLALFEAGSWAGADRQLAETTKLNDAATPKRPEPALITGVLAAWRGETGAAAGSFLQALEADPNNVLALQELGRVLVMQKNWEAADRYLEKAIHTGASPEARLLRVRALLEEGDIVEAGREMDQYTAGRDVRTLSPEARTLYIQVQDRLSLEPYAKVKSVLTESPQELVKTIPELRGIPITSDQTELPGLLKKVGEGVEAFFKNFPNTVSLEQVHQERLGKDGKVARALDQDFQYLLLASAEKWGLGIEEHRTTPKGEIAALSGLDQGLMLTAGFASASLLFHPANQDGVGFRYLGRQTSDGEDANKSSGVQEILTTSDGRKLLLKPNGTWKDVKEELPPGKGMHVIAFAQKPEKARTTERFKTDTGSALVLVQGVAWIDPTTYQVVRLRTDLLAPQATVRLERQTTEIHYQQVPFKGMVAALWLPQEVTVTVDWKGRVYRNWHRYSDFKVFNVETKEQRKSFSPPAPSEQVK